jgi:maltooligosyltrehalose trehalohydrolase
VHSSIALDIGATFLDDGRCQFLVWAPRAKRIELRLLPSLSSRGKQSAERIVAMEPLERGYYRTIADDVDPASCYVYRLEGENERPDPASRFQPEGVHGPSETQPRPATGWDDPSWVGLPLEQYILYELHVGTFTPEGTFDAIIPRLDELSDLGITAIELMPIAQFPATGTGDTTVSTPSLCRIPTEARKDCGGWSAHVIDGGWQSFSTSFITT